MSRAKIAWRWGSGGTVAHGGLVEMIGDTPRAWWYIFFLISIHAHSHISQLHWSHVTLPQMKTLRTETKCIFMPTQCIAVWRARPGLLGGRDKATAEGGLCLQETARDGTSLESLQVHALTLFSGECQYPDACNMNENFKIRLALKQRNWALFCADKMYHCPLSKNRRWLQWEDCERGPWMYICFPSLWSLSHWGTIWLRKHHYNAIWQDFSLDNHLGSTVLCNEVGYKEMVSFPPLSLHLFKANSDKHSQARFWDGRGVLNYIDLWYITHMIYLHLYSTK